MQKPIKLLKRAGYFFPFTLYLLVFSAAIIPGYFWLHHLSKLPESAYREIFHLLLFIALLFSVSILCFGFITVFVSFIYFKLKRRKNQIAVKINTLIKDQTIQNTQTITIHISPVLLPLMGFLRVRLIYDHSHFSNKFSIAMEKNRLFGFSFDGEFTWNLPEIREYQIEKVIVYFEDFFQFFSFATTIDATNRFHISPTNQNLATIKASPRKTEETTIRIDELKRVEGELINYKNFETNDDVRRIVWKIYAKNKELVVRIPETMDPYASHIYLYTSFHSQFNTGGNEVIEAPFLNYYKTVCWSVYKQLAKKGLEVRYIPDQTIPPANLLAEEWAKYAVTVSSWQSDVDVKDFIKPGQASVLIISSLNDLEEIKEFVENFGSEISIVFVPLSDALKQNNIGDWLKWLFIENETDKLASFKTKWNLSPLRLKVSENEKQILQALKQTDRATVI